MLVLSRKLHERIKIGDDVYLTVVQIDHGRVRLGIEAPQGVKIMRSELLTDAPDEAPPETAAT